MKVPDLGWITSDPEVAHALLNDPKHCSLLSEGGVGDLWAQILDDWVTNVFDGPGHHDVRTRSRELCTEKNSHAFVSEARGDRLETARADFDNGAELALADLSRVLVGRLVAALLMVAVPRLRHPRWVGWRRSSLTAESSTAYWRRYSDAMTPCEKPYG